MLICDVDDKNSFIVKKIKSCKREKSERERQRTSKRKKNLYIKYLGIIMQEMLSFWKMPHFLIHHQKLVRMKLKRGMILTGMWADAPSSSSGKTSITLNQSCSGTYRSQLSHLELFQWMGGHKKQLPAKMSMTTSSCQDGPHCTAQQPSPASIPELFGEAADPSPPASPSASPLLLSQTSSSCGTLDGVPELTLCEVLATVNVNYSDLLNHDFQIVCTGL